ncbi:SGNH/GDSL hydrolase family protein [Mesorhizobium xinjiangense]|uniref:SGNH/GDSL hydrolase family protein n=1 Tax=Mesorhizobium xinjiangense TaxID=2678685 RepID=UPI0012EE90BB|nr:DUF459 domain-containing protein [Mesorhizobium xinjiangense]
MYCGVAEHRHTANKRARGRIPAGRLAGVLALAALALMALMPTQQAVAQERPRTLLEFLFPGMRAEPRRERQRTVAPRRRSTTTRPVRRTRPARQQPAAPPTPVVEKAADARKILVVGDFMGAGLAEGLAEAAAENPNLIIVERTKGSSGLVRDDYYDWLTELPPILEEESPAVAVMMIGSNDRQAMRVAGRSEPVRSEDWTSEYERRANGVAAIMEDAGMPFVWVGQPAFRPGKMSSDMIAFNDILRQAAEAHGGAFVDIWDGFVDEQGAFAANGPDINGQPVRLRAGDGINLTRAGKRKIAFYAERPLERILGIAISGSPSETPEAAVPVAPEDISSIDRTPPISLVNPSYSDDVELLGAGRPDKHDEARTAAEKLVIEGIAPESRPGRVDDYSVRRTPSAGP